MMTTNENVVYTEKTTTNESAEEIKDTTTNESDSDVENNTGKEISEVKEKNTEKKVKISIKKLTKHWGESDQLAVNNVSFDVYDGEFLSILGPSGCGKTTIMRMIIGLIEPTSGEIWKDGKDITKEKVSNRKMGMVFQNYALFENMTVLQNVEYALKFHKDTKAKARDIATQMLSKMHLTKFLDKKPAELSGGQQQRVAIARTLALKPDVILFDEPMSALDIATRHELCEEIKRIQSVFKTTIIYITHDQEEAFTMSDRIMVMDVSKISQIGTPEEILKSPANNYVRQFVCENLKKKIKSLEKIVEMSNEEN